MASISASSSSRSAEMSPANSEVASGEVGEAALSSLVTLGAAVSSVSTLEGTAAALVDSSSCFASVSAIGINGASDFLGHVLELCPGRPQMLHFLDILCGRMITCEKMWKNSSKNSEAMTHKGKKPQCQPHRGTNLLVL